MDQLKNFHTRRSHGRVGWLERKAAFRGKGGKNSLKLDLLTLKGVEGSSIVILPRLELLFVDQVKSEKLVQTGSSSQRWTSSS